MSRPSDLRDPAVRLVTQELDASGRWVRVEPAIRLSLFTQAGSERRCDLTAPQALKMIEQLAAAVSRTTRPLA